MSHVILIAEGPTALTAAQSLAEHAEIAAIFRKRLVANDVIPEFAASRSIPLIADTSLARIRGEIERLRPACVVISSYDRVIPLEILKLSRFVNVHYGPLPAYRGRANVNWAILNHESKAAITIHVVDSNLDSGNILFQDFIPIGPHSTVTELYDRLNDIQHRMLGRTVARHISGYMGILQTGVATYCCTRVPEDGEIDWKAPTQDTYALIRALASPYPGAYTFFRQQKIVISRAMPVVDARHYVGRIPGRVCSVDLNTGGIDVLTGDGILRIYEITEEIGVRTRAANLIRSTKDTLGLTSYELLHRIQELENMLANRERDLATDVFPRRMAASG